MAQTLQIMMFERAHPKWEPATVAPSYDLLVNVIEKTNFSESSRAKSGKTAHREERVRVVDVRLTEGTLYHAYIDSENSKAALFVPMDGWFEMVEVDTKHLTSIVKRTEPPVNYREWGIKKQVIMEVTKVGPAKR